MNRKAQILSDLGIDKAISHTHDDMINDYADAMDEYDRYRTMTADREVDRQHIAKMKRALRADKERLRKNLGLDKLKPVKKNINDLFVISDANKRPNKTKIKTRKATA